MNERKRIFLSFLNPDYSRSGVVLNEHDSKNIFLRLPTRPLSIINLLLRMRNEFDSSEVIIVVMSPSHLLVPYLKIFTRFRVILDAGWPLSDAIQQNHNYLKKLYVKLTNGLIDLISFTLCDLLILESQEQVRRISRKKFVRKKKITARLTGLNELAFQSVAPMQPAEITSLLSQRKIILYRGKNNPESGISFLVSLQEFLRPDWLLVIVSNKMIEPLDLKKSVLINRHISNAEILWLYQNAKLSLGQLSNKKRLKFTIPHKAFESAFFGVPYISPKQEVLNELFGSNENYLTLENLNKESILETIEKYMADEHKRREIGKKARDNYLIYASQQRLSEIFNATLNANQ